MTDQNLTELIFILDRSGSMADLIDESIKGFNSLIKQQIETDKLTNLRSNVTLVIFDDEYNLFYEAIDINKVLELTKKEFFARGGTALLDAIGVTINSVGNRLASLPEEQRPGKVMITIMTDGCENSSRDFSKSVIKEMIITQTDQYSWLFNYLGANQDAFSEAGAIGIRSDNVSNYSSDILGTQAAIYSMGLRCNSYKSGNVISTVEAYKQALSENKPE